MKRCILLEVIWRKTLVKLVALSLNRYAYFLLKIPEELLLFQLLPSFKLLGKILLSLLLYAPALQTWSFGKKKQGHCGDDPFMPSLRSNFNISSWPLVSCNSSIWLFVVAEIISWVHNWPESSYMKFSRNNLTFVRHATMCEHILAYVTKYLKNDISFW